MIPVAVLLEQFGGQAATGQWRHSFWGWGRGRGKREREEGGGGGGREGCETAAIKAVNIGGWQFVAMNLYSVFGSWAAGHELIR